VCVWGGGGACRFNRTFVFGLKWTSSVVAFDACSAGQAITQLSLTFPRVLLGQSQLVRGHHHPFNIFVSVLVHVQDR